jgi:carbon starvation protein CstA
MNGGRARYEWVTLLPLAFVAPTTLTAGWLAATQKFPPMANFQGRLFAGLLLSMTARVLLILGEPMLRWYRIATGRIAVPRAA